MAERLAKYDRFYGVYGSVKQRKLAFDCYMKKQKALVKVAKRLIPDKNTCSCRDEPLRHLHQRLLVLHVAVERQLALLD